MKFWFRFRLTAPFVVFGLAYALSCVSPTPHRQATFFFNVSIITAIIFHVGSIRWRSRGGLTDSASVFPLAVAASPVYDMIAHQVIHYRGWSCLTAFVISIALYWVLTFLDCVLGKQRKL